MRTSKRAPTKDQRSWLPTDPKQILLAFALVVLVGGSIAWIMRYQAMQPQPVPKEKYAEMYKAMYGTKLPAAPPGMMPPGGPPPAGGR